MLNNRKLQVFFLFMLIILSSCVSRKEVRYIQESESDNKTTYENIRKSKIIDSYDKLYIKVYNLDPDISGLFMERNSNMQNISLISYTVDEEGFLDFPFVGKVKVGGLNIEEAKVVLEKELNNYLPNTSIILRYVGNVITVVGEVNRQGEYPFYDDKINIFQALSYAGGINDYGNKSKVKIIREVNNKINYFELDLSKETIVESPQYYLIPNDIIVIEPINAKFRTYRDFALISMMLSAISTTILVINLLQ